jgi:DNA-binding response OmpR family regulator
VHCELVNFVLEVYILSMIVKPSDFKILIVEDDFETQFLFGEVLKMEDYHVDVTSNGQEALDLIEKSGLPNLLIMDLTFPLMTPEEFVEKINAAHSGAKLPIIIISGKGDIQDYVPRLGAVAAFRKPFDLDPVVNQVREIFSQSLQ